MALLGVILWVAPLGDYWINASYDYLFRFDSRTVTNRVALILMDNTAFEGLHQTREKPWDRALHTQLLNRLTDDGCALVVLDSFLQESDGNETDKALALAMSRQRHIVLMAEQSQITHPTLAGVQPILPNRLFLDAAGTNWGVAWLDPDLDAIVRRHWPFPSPGINPSLPWTAACLFGAKMSELPQERWVRYYGQKGAWVQMSYNFALVQAPGYFRNQIVFIGNRPKTSMPDGELDKFSTPYSRWTGETVGGVEILLTSFLNLLNDESLLRPPWWLELLLLGSVGIALGWGLCRLRTRNAVAVAVGVFVLVLLTAISLSHYTNYWFPWLIIAGGQLPCALIWTAAVKVRARWSSIKKVVTEPLPDTPGYKLIQPPFGEGAYGKVWLAKNKAGQWRALKVVYLAKFNHSQDPYGREYEGIQKYLPISDQHPGLLRVDFVSEKNADYFYYAMELGDSVVPDWQDEPTSYQPRDLDNERAKQVGRRLPAKDCARIGITLCEALEFIHRQGMTHRDIKPPNVIFVNGRPKLTDFGLVTDIRPTDGNATLVGTPGFMPPPPDHPGTISADIYALGMLLYVLSTGRAAALFPEMATTLVNTDDSPEFLALNDIILKACEPLPENRYLSAGQMRLALAEMLANS